MYYVELSNENGQIDIYLYGNVTLSTTKYYTKHTF